MNYDSILAIKNFEAQAERLGFEIKAERYYDGRGDRQIALYPKGDCYPCYNREFDIRTGSVESLMAFMSGIEFCRNYHADSLKLEKQIEKAENKIRNKRLMEVIME